MRSAGIHQLRQDLVLTVNFIERTAGFIRRGVRGFFLKLHVDISYSFLQPLIMGTVQD